MDVHQHKQSLDQQSNYNSDNLNDNYPLNAVEAINEARIKGITQDAINKGLKTAQYFEEYYNEGVPFKITSGGNVLWADPFWFIKPKRKEKETTESNDESTKAQT